MFELESLSLKDLKQLQKDVESAIANFRNREREKALAEVEAFARERGLNPADLASLVGRKGKKSVGTAKYANPADRSQTWTGRGRKPAWAAAALAAGKSLDDLAL